VTPRRYAPWLSLLAGLFALRVAAQAAALVIGNGADGVLPGFEAWHGGVLPYPLLLASQVLILAWLVQQARRFSAGEVAPNRRVGTGALAFGAVYFVTMFVRLILGLTVLRGHRWFGAPLPALFHLVLATYVLLYGHFHARAPKPAA
jgi:hypothetical protein